MAAATPISVPGGRARWTRLIPVAIIVYVISFMDRTNIGFAFTGMGNDLHISKFQQGLAGGIFFIGYLALQIPGGYLAERWSAKKFVGIMIFIWGVFAFACGLVRNYPELLAARFLLGVAEGGIWPAILVLISHWFPARERARAYGFWMMNIAISSIITAPLSGWILTWGDWRTLFYIEGAFPFVIAAPLWWWLAADRPSQASWVSDEEREYIETSLARENAGEPRNAGYRDALRSSVVWRLVLVYFLIQVGFYGLNLWLPHLVKGTIGGSYLTVGAITAIPYLFAIVGLWINARSADRTGRYSIHVMASLALGAVALVLSVAFGSIVALSVILVSIAMAGALAYDGPFWASASRAVPVALAGGAMGLINALGNLGGFVGPSLGGMLQDASGGSFLSTAIVLAVALVLGGLVMLTLRRQADKPVHVAQPEAAAEAYRPGAGRSRLRLFPAKTARGHRNGRECYREARLSRAGQSPAGKRIGYRNPGRPARMLWTHGKSRPRRSGRELAGPAGVGAAAALAAVAGVMLGRKAVTIAKIGQGHPLKHRVLDAAAGAMQPKYPLNAMSTYLNAFHMYADEMGRQVEACHFCIHLRHDLHQCVIFDRNAADARLIGIEYITTEERFRGFPDDEKRLWHSHHYEVKSGELVAPGIPDLAEHAYFSDLVTTYGKTFHTWQYDRDDFPYGIPQLMMAFTQDGQANEAQIHDRDRRIGVSTARKRQDRADIPWPEVVPGANSWESGQTVQTCLEEMGFKR